MELASAFDPGLVGVVRPLAKGDDGRFPTWRCLVNHARAEPVVN